jgi:hypothetical protein
MLFSVIYCIDTPADVDILGYAPPRVEELWDATEDDGQYEFSYLEGRWENGHHRKWVAVLTRDQFDEFVRDCSLIAEDVQTLGSLGAPGCGLGWSPAISFRSDDADAIQAAHVTPLPETKKVRFDERDWERVRSAVLAVYA